LVFQTSKGDRTFVFANAVVENDRRNLPLHRIFILLKYLYYYVIF